jgi:hypothetical protein
MKTRVVCVVLAILSTMRFAVGQQAATSATVPAVSASSVPRLIRFSGVAKDANGKPLTGTIGITFLLYKDEQGSVPLWMETQNVQPDANGHYSVQLGSTQPNGLPTDVFTSGEARWLGVQPQGQEEQPRILLMSVPYAIKAQEAETLAGKTVSDFVLSDQAAKNPVSQGSTQKPTTPPRGTAGSAAVVNDGPTDFTGTTTDQIVKVTQHGTGAGLVSVTPSTTFPAIMATVTASSGIATALSGTTMSTNGTGVHGDATASTGATTGVTGTASSSSGYGVLGSAFAATGNTIGVKGVSASPSGFGVQGANNASSGGTGIQGTALGTSGLAFGVDGISASPSGTGLHGVNTASGGTAVQGFATATTGPATGVYGQTASTSGNGVRGNATATSGQAFGVDGISASPSGIGVQGANTASSGGTGVVGTALATSGQAFGVDGLSASPLGAGLHGANTASGGTAVQGFATSTSGVSVGINGFSASPRGIGVQANNTATGGVVSLAGSAPFIIDAFTTKTLFSVDNSGNGFYAGNLNVTGKLTKGSGSFKIDHPLDPANKYLSHSFVESPDMMNVYNGNITTDRHGLATVILPAYFEALNQDFRYQLTVIGQFAQAIVKQEIENNRFTIKTNRPLVKVSWQVTGIRHDAYADAYRILVEEEKSAAEQGSYLHPEVFGKPPSKSVTAAAKLGVPPDYVVAGVLQK